MDSKSCVIKWGGLSLVAFALLSGTIMLIQAVWFSYPLPYEGAMRYHIPIVFFQNQSLRMVLTAGCVIPLLMIPGIIGLERYLRDEDNHHCLLIARYFGVIAALTWCLTEMVWPSINWFVSHTQLFNASDMLITLVNGINAFFHVYIGEYIRLLTLAVWVLAVSRLAYKNQRLPSWLCVVGMVLAILMMLLLVGRWLFISPYIIEHAIDFTPLINFWIFLVGGIIMMKHYDKGRIT